MSAKIIPINTRREALAWGDGWERAHEDLRRQAEREIAGLQWQLLMVQVDLTIEKASRTLERLALEDEIARLTKLIGCPF